MQRIRLTVVLLVVMSFLSGCALVLEVHDVVYKKNEEIKAWYNETKQNIHWSKKSDVIEKTPAAQSEATKTGAAEDIVNDPDVIEPVPEEPEVISPEEAPSSIDSEEAPSSIDSGEAPSSTDSEEAPSSTNSEEALSSTDSEEAKNLRTLSSESPIMFSLLGLIIIFVFVLVVAFLVLRTRNRNYGIDQFRDEVVERWNSLFK